MHGRKEGLSETETMEEKQMNAYRGRRWWIGVFFIGWPLIRPCNMMSSSESSCIYTVPPCLYGSQHRTKSTEHCNDMSFQQPYFLTSPVTMSLSALEFLNLFLSIITVTTRRPFFFDCDHPMIMTELNLRGEG